jgi:hypothetical protein
MSKQRAYQLAKELGCEITHEEGDRILLDAIPPMKLSAHDGHCLVYPIEDGIKCQTTGRTAWQDIIEDLKYGVERCDTADCEICAGL